VILTPHVSGYNPRYFTMVIDLFRENLGRWVRGERLRNVVNKRLGYAEA
jgi:phosphoglycerate dehydrogenase-like enzyme